MRDAARQSPLSATGDGDVSAAAPTSGIHGSRFRKTGFRDADAASRENGRNARFRAFAARSPAHSGNGRRETLGALPARGEKCVP